MRSRGFTGRSGTTALEFAFAAPVVMVMLFACLEYGRMFWTWQVLQLTSDQTARCVAIVSSACPTPSDYAMTTATRLGVTGLLASGVLVDNKPPAVTNATVCSPPSGNTQLRVRLSFSFTSPVATLIPTLNQVLTTTSCYPLTGN